MPQIHCLQSVSKFSLKLKKKSWVCQNFLKSSHYSKRKEQPYLCKLTRETWQTTAHILWSSYKTMIFLNRRCVRISVALLPCWRVRMMPRPAWCRTRGWASAGWASGTPPSTRSGSIASSYQTGRLAASPLFSSYKFLFQLNKTITLFFTEW